MEWISVKDKLPTERYCPVLVFNANSPGYAQCVLQASWYLQENKFRIEVKTFIPEGDITHWMPLPEGPL